VGEIRVVVAKRGVVFAKEPEALRAKRVASRVKHLGTLNQYGMAVSWREIFPPFTRTPDVRKAKIMTVEEFKDFVREHLASLKRRFSDETVAKIMARIDECVRMIREEKWVRIGRAELVIFKGSLKPYIKRVRTSRYYLIAETKNFYVYLCDEDFWLFIRKMKDEEIIERVDELKKYVEDMEFAKGFIEEYRKHLDGYEDAIEYLDKVMSMIRLLR